MIAKHFFLKTALFLILAYWILDSSVHFFIYGEFEFEIIPAEFNELWMRCLIVFLLLVFGFFADYQTKKITKKEQEKNEIYISMLNANQHILNNFLQAMMLFRSAAEKSKDIDPKILTLYDKAIKNTVTQINNLHDIQEPSKKNIEDRFLPKHPRYKNNGSKF